MKHVSKKVVAVGGAIIGVLVAVLLLPGYAGYLYSRTEYLDLGCGRLRIVREYCRLARTEEFKETPLSKMYRKVVGETPEPQWEFMHSVEGRMRWCNTQSPIGDVKILGEILSEGPFTDEARKKAILTFLELARDKETREKASLFVSDVLDACADDKDTVNKIDASEIPGVPEEDTFKERQRRRDGQGKESAAGN